MGIREMIDQYIAWCSRHRAPATCEFYRSRLRVFRNRHAEREFASLTTLEVDECLADSGVGMSDSTRHHNAVALERLQEFALDHKLLERPLFARLEKPRVGQRDRIPSAAQTEAILARSSAEFRLIYSALRQCGA